MANRFHPGARWHLNPYRPYSYIAMERWINRLVAGKRPSGKTLPRIVRRAVPQRWWLTPASLDRTMPLYARLLAKRRIS